VLDGDVHVLDRLIQATIDAAAQRGREIADEAKAAAPLAEATRLS
jgi:hypothetical protein